MKTIVAALGVACLSLGLADAVEAKNAKPRTMCQRATALRHDVVRTHGKRAPGRDICRWGLKSGKQPTKHQRARYLRALRVLMTPPTYPTLQRTAVPPPRPPAGTASPGVRAGGTLSAIRQCESGGNYATNTGNGFYGAYQFTQGTWESVGGSGNPAAASPAEQDRRAAMLYAREGAAPWPVCGR